MTTKKVKGNICPWLTKDIKNKMNDRDKMLRKARKSMQEIDWSAYKLCRNRVQAQIKKCKNQYYKNLLKDSLNSPDKFWKAIKSVFPTKAMSPKTNPSFNVDGKTITDKNVIANVFCRYFSTVANSLKRKSIYLREFVWKKPGHHKIKSIKSFKFSNISERDVFIKLRKLQRKKACGYDELPSGMLRDAASVILEPLAHIINMSLSSGIVPTKWKIAKVIPLYKSGPKSDIGNYRPISILPVLSKVLESLVHQKLISYLEENRLLYDHQFGFRSKRSTELAVTLLVDKIRKEADKGNITGAIYIDLSKAFDTMSHSSLLDKLPSYGIKDLELLWFTDYLFLRKQIVEYDGVYSNTESVTVGVPQGSILGPLVFLILFNDVHKSLKADLHIGRFTSLCFAEKVETHSTFKTIRAYRRELKILRNNSNCACSSAVRFARAARATEMEIGLNALTNSHIR